jgi:polyisoprenyl-teichoic acid--peptidoglycan teichoic acid transferase
MDEETNLRHLRMSHRKKRFGGKSKVFLVIIFFLLAAFAWSIFSAGSSVFTYVFSQGEPIKSTDGRVNVLLLGLAGGNHDGALLTDSIIIASYNLNNHYVTLISVPRDLWLDSIHQKVNAAYEIGQASKNGGNGLKYAEDKIDDILGIPIHYGVRIDFSGFEKAIDQIGGVDVEVSNTFDDYEYPITGKEDDLCGYQDTFQDLNPDQAKDLNVPPGKTHVYIDPQGKVSTDSASLNFDCRFEHIHFDKGTTHMDGTTALKFVRSRHALGAEGTDFARSKRQQVVLEAFRTKALSLQTLANPAKVSGLIGALGSSVETDIPADKVPEFYKIGQKLDGTQNIVLGDLGNGKSILINPPVGQYGQWVLIPPNNDFTPVKVYIKQKLTEQDASTSAKAK